jgi:hypothetical protein
VTGWLPLSREALRIGAVIALIRLLVFSCGLYLLGFGDSRQIVGYIMLMLNSIVEISFASALWGRRPGGQLLTAVFIGATSILLGYGWTRLHRTEDNERSES